MVGMIAAVLTTSAFVPQVIKVVKTKDTTGISLLMYIMQVIGLSMWLLHGLLIKDWPLIIANAITIVLAFIVLVYKIKFSLIKVK